MSVTFPERVVMSQWVRMVAETIKGYSAKIWQSTLKYMDNYSHTVSGDNYQLLSLVCMYRVYEYYQSGITIDFLISKQYRHTKKQFEDLLTLIPEIDRIDCPVDFIGPKHAFAKEVSTLMQMSQRSFGISSELIAESALAIEENWNAKECTHTFVDGLLDVYSKQYFNMMLARNQNPQKIVWSALIASADKVKGCVLKGKYYDEKTIQKEEEDSLSNLLKGIKENKDFKSLAKHTESFCDLLANGVFVLGKRLGKGLDGTAYDMSMPKTPGLKMPVVIKRFSFTREDAHEKEIIIHAICNSILHPNVLRLYAYFSCDSTYYIITEKADGAFYALNAELETKYKVKEDFRRVQTALLFQIVYALYYLQGKFKFTHYDLHYNNIYYVKVPSENKKYVLRNPLTGKNVEYSIPNYGYRLILADFGFARVEYEGKVYTGNVEDDSYYRTSAYNPLADICSLGFRDGDFLRSILPDECDWVERGKYPHIKNIVDLEVREIIPIMYKDYIINDDSKLPETDFTKLADMYDDMGMVPIPCRAILSKLKSSGAPDELIEELKAKAKKKKSPPKKPTLLPGDWVVDDWSESDLYRDPRSRGRKAKAKKKKSPPKKPALLPGDWVVDDWSESDLYRDPRSRDRESRWLVQSESPGKESPDDWIKGLEKEIREREKKGIREREI